LKDLVGELKTEASVAAAATKAVTEDAAPHPRLTPPRPQPPLANKVA
jgi:hypothetical protein